MNKKMLELLIELVSNKVLDVYFDSTLLEWAKEEYLEDLVLTRKELQKQLELLEV